MPHSLHVGLLYGGLSSEHDVSILSARNVYRALESAGHRVTPIRIDRSGRWHAEASADALFADGDPPRADGTTHLVPGGGCDAVVVHGPDGPASLGLDVVFPILHGQNGEDGVVQGLLNALGLPYVGPGVLGSAVCMDKEVTKRLLADAGLPIGPFVTVRAASRDDLSAQAVGSALGWPVFVKPANSGSSVGITKVEGPDGLASALDTAFDYDTKVLVEAAVVGREVECAVLGNETPEASVLGEIVSTSTFYDYEAKYLDPDAARMEVPADLPADVSDRARALAIETYTMLGCEGMARVDFFVTPDGGVLVNEVNTIPGFTARSMYPVMWAEAGLDGPALAERLVTLALNRHRRDAALKTTR